TWDSPGVKVESARDRTAADIGASLNEIDFSQVCTNGGRTPYQDPFYIGESQLWTECDGTGAIYIVVAAVPADGSFMVRVEIQAVEPRDLDAADRVLDTFVAT
ncbi:MAG: peptidase S1, partial [Acidimicrobiia bacterium]|nr:peptidase S1 [Acidimicrobiia bacterium]